MDAPCGGFRPSTARPRHRCLFPREDKLRSRVHAVHYLYEIVGKDGKS
jgi:hypothetical protein